MMNSEKYAVDRIENDIVVLENIRTKEIKNINISSIPFAKEKDILLYKDGVYYIDSKEKRKRLNYIKKKMNQLKRKK